MWLEIFGQKAIDGDAASEKRFGRDEEGSIWTQFTKAKSAEEFCRLWLAIQCTMMDNIKGAVILLGKPDEGPFVPVAVWPDTKRDMQYLASIAQRSLMERQGLVIQGDASNPNSQYVAYPIEVDGTLHGVIVLDVLQAPNRPIRTVLRQLHWGTAWLELLFLRKQNSQGISMQERMITSFDLIATTIEKDDFTSSATAFVTEMSSQFQCERVSLGFVRKKRIELKALSNTAQFEKKMSLSQALCSAMEEAIDQSAVITYPETDEEVLITRAHRELSEKFGAASIYTIPLSHGDQLIGCLLMECGARANSAPLDIDMCEGLLALAGPMLYIQYCEERWLPAKISESCKYQLHKVFGPNYPGTKLALIAIAAIILFFSFAKTDYRITATSSIEGAVQRTVVAPFDAYIKETLVRAGDIINKGDPMIVLDDRDLAIERTKLISEREQLLKKFREAMAKHELAQVRIIRSQIEKATAQLHLVDEQLARTRITAPFDGLVISGDMTQSLGAPVERGKVLFEVAPLNDYRIILEVDEQEICDVRPSQSGILILRALPDQSFPFRVQKITPVSIAEEGKNYFRVEASLAEVSNQLRPGMEGVGKISIDRRRLIWIWTHKAVDWVRLQIWSLWP